MWATTWARRAAGGDVCRGASTVCTVGRPGAGVPCRARVESEANLTHVLRGGLDSTMGYYYLGKNFSIFAPT